MTTDVPSTARQPRRRARGRRLGLSALALGSGALAYAPGTALAGLHDQPLRVLAALAAAAASPLLLAAPVRALQALRAIPDEPLLQDLVRLTAPPITLVTGADAPGTAPAAVPAGGPVDQHDGHGAPGRDSATPATVPGAESTASDSASDSATDSASDNEKETAMTSTNSQAAPSTGLLYVMTNQQTGNSVRVFHRADDGNLTLAGTYPTGGLGGGSSTDLNLALDPLVAQGALTISDDRRFLFAVDAGSDELSVLAIHGDTLVPVDRVPSGGVRPVSVTTHKNLVYVANSTTATIAGYTVSVDGRLTPVEGSQHTLIGGVNAGPSQIQFSPDGTKLVVSERQTQTIDVFHVDELGRTGAPVKNASNGIGPFGLTFQTNDVLLVTEVNNAVSSYRLGDDGTLTLITGSLGTELATCWSVQSVLDPTVVYVTNAQSGSVSGIRFDENGAITELTGDGHTAVLRDQHGAQDIVISPDGQFVYVLTDGYDEKLTDPRLPTFIDGASYSGKMSISAFRVEPRGGLSPAGGFGVGADEVVVNLQFGSVTGYIEGLEPGHEGMVAT